MVKNAAHKSAAREYQANHPGTTFPEAMRAVSRKTSPPPPPDRRIPWLRERPGGTKVGCYFCGKDTAILSMTDYAADNGRLQIYCDNSECAAREIELIVLRGGDPATTRRTDVRVLANIPATAYHQASQDPDEYEHWMPGASPAARRAQPAALRCLFCGERSCVLSFGDVPADTGRIQICCENSGCAARQIEVLVDRDDSEATFERPDMKALREIDLPPQLRSTGQFVVRPFHEVSAAYESDDRLGRRLGR